MIQPPCQVAVPRASASTTEAGATRQAANRPRMLSLIDYVRNIATPYLRQLIERPEQLESSRENRRRILEACKRRDGLLAEAEVRKHLEDVSKANVALVESAASASGSHQVHASSRRADCTELAAEPSSHRHRLEVVQVGVMRRSRRDGRSGSVHWKAVRMVTSQTGDRGGIEGPLTASTSLPIDSKRWQAERCSDRPVIGHERRQKVLSRAIGQQDF